GCGDRCPRHLSSLEDRYRRRLYTGRKGGSWDRGESARSGGDAISRDVVGSMICGVEKGARWVNRKRNRLSAWAGHERTRTYTQATGGCIYREDGNVAIRVSIRHEQQSAKRVERDRKSPTLLSAGSNPGDRSQADGTSSFVNRETGDRYAAIGHV